MKQIMLIIVLLLTGSRILAQSNNRITTYNYQAGNLVVNTITYRVNVSSNNIFVENVANTLNSIPRTHPELECREAHFSKPEWIRIENVFRQVLPATRRNVFRGAGNLVHYSITANEMGQIQEITFSFERGSPITPQEIYQLEVGLKALTLQYNFPPTSCAGVIYRNISTGISISEL